MDREYYEFLAISILSVNSYPLERVWPLRDSLRRHDLFSPEVVAKWDHKTAITQLVSSGYDRGATMNSIFASRLQELALQRDALNEIWQLVNAGANEQASQKLLQLRGVGPAVLRNFWALQKA